LQLNNDTGDRFLSEKSTFYVVIGHAKKLYVGINIQCKDTLLRFCHDQSLGSLGVLIFGEWRPEMGVFFPFYFGFLIVLYCKYH